MSPGDYGLYFGLTLVLSTLFAMGGVGSAIALVPSFTMVGMAFDLARALGLFVNTAATAAASATHFRHGMLDVRFALPLVGESFWRRRSGPGSANMWRTGYWRVC